jgi:hypothetical protein
MATIEMTVDSEITDVLAEVGMHPDTLKVDGVCFDNVLRWSLETVGHDLIECSQAPDKIPVGVARGYVDVAVRIVEVLERLNGEGEQEAGAA